MTPIDRRGFLAATAAGFASTRQAVASDRQSFSLALGGGAARGLAHIPILEALDELGIKPAAIAGTSMGAIIGSCYASGMSGREIREYAVELFARRVDTLRRLFPGNPTSWISIFALSNSAVLEAETLMAAVLPEQVPRNFSDLAIRLRVVATDFHRQEEFVIEGGLLHKAVGASAALPVFLAPVVWNERVLIDGGFVNPTPFDIFGDVGGPVVAVDVTGNSGPGTGDVPGALDTWIGASQIALHSLVNERLKRVAPELLIRPEVGRFSSLEFQRIDEILAAGEAEKETAKRQLATLLEL